MVVFCRRYYWPSSLFLDYIRLQKICFILEVLFSISIIILVRILSLTLSDTFHCVVNFIFMVILGIINNLGLLQCVIGIPQLLATDRSFCERKPHPLSCVHRRGIQTISGLDCFKVAIQFGCGFQFSQKPIYVHAKWY